MKMKNNTEVIVGINIDDSVKGYSYSFMDKNNIIMERADSNYKVTNEVILNDDNDIICLGAECERYLKEKGLGIGHYFEQIIKNIDLKNNIIISLYTQKVLPLSLVLQKIGKIKEICLKEIERNRPILKESNIKWVIAISSFWDKTIIWEACNKAGLNKYNSLFYIIEPEASSFIYF